MKKLILAIGLGVALTFGASAQTHTSQSFLSVYSVTISNSITVTNLSFPGLTTRTNPVGLYWSNAVNSASGVVVTGASASTINLTKPVSLWTDRAGSPVGMSAITNGLQAANQFAPCFSQISVGLTATNAAANANVTFTFAPIPGSLQSGTAPDLSTAPIGGNEWSFSVLATGVTPVQIITNCPTWLWPGCKGLVLKRIVNADTDAASAVTVYNLALDGFIP